jgi:penicillin-binding protein 1B
MSARRAVELSINIPTVRAALTAELSYVVAAARATGIDSKLKPYPSVALGAFEISPMEIAAAYSVFANSGVRVEPFAIVGVETSDGRLLDRKETPLTQALPADAVFLVDSLLRGAVDRGTAAGARAGGLGGVLAGKTGTTNDGRDAWFVGFSPRMLTAIWVGYDDSQPRPQPGLQGRGPHLRGVLALDPFSGFRREFPCPVQHRDRRHRSGRQATLGTSGTPQRKAEVLISCTAPTQRCPVHGR